MYNFKYVAKDYRNMLDGELEKTVVRSGAIDYQRLFQYFHSEEMAEPSPDEMQKLRIAYHKLIPKLTRCQMELLLVEFGVTEIPFNEAELVSDILTCDPPKASVEKLEAALNKLYHLFLQQ